MSDSTQISQSLIDLGEVIRRIEKESGQPSQLVVKVGDDNYLIGDLRKRAGKYRLEMQDEYKDTNPLKTGGKIQNPHKNLAGTYDSFKALDDAIKLAQKQPDERDGKAIYLLGNPNSGYSVTVPGINLGRGGGRQYIRIGRIIPPLLQEGEKVTVDKLEK